LHRNQPGSSLCELAICPKCGGKLRLYRRALKICIKDPGVIATILEPIRPRRANEILLPAFFVSRHSPST